MAAGAEAAASEISGVAEVLAGPAAAQGLTLVHISIQRERFSEETWCCFSA
jgi:hypothetical protein